MVAGRLSAEQLRDLLPVNHGLPAYVWLATAVRQLVADGQILHGTKLPSERDVTRTLGLSRTTVARAYESLRERGYLARRQGSGTVATIPGGPRLETPNLPLPSDPACGVIDLTVAAPAASGEVGGAYRAAMAELPGYLGGTGYHPLGLPVLRQQIADGYTARGCQTSADQILVTSGALTAAAVLARAFLTVGDRVVTENPGYPNAIATLRRAGARLTGIPVRAPGHSVRTYDAVIGQVAPRLAYLIPDFHNPTGLLMSGADRDQLAGVLRRHRVLPVIDETLAAVNLSAEAVPPPFASVASSALTIGGVSKSHWGGLRIGWIRSPQAHMGRLLAARITLDLGSSVLDQLAVAHLLRRPVAQRHLAQLRANRDDASAELARTLPEWLVQVPDGGLSLWYRLPEPRSAALVVHAGRNGVLLAPGSSFAVDGRGLEQWLRIPYTLPNASLRAALARLPALWAEIESSRNGRPRRLVVV